MLKRFQVSNFKSLVNVGFDPTGLNLLVGTNNAGKTNLCHALRFLGLTSHKSLHDAAKQCTAEPWNLMNVYTTDDKLAFEVQAVLPSEESSGVVQLEFSYGLQLGGIRDAASQRHRPPLSIVNEYLRVSGGPFDNALLLTNERGEVRLSEERFRQRIDGMPTEARVPVDSTMLSRLYGDPGLRSTNLFKNYLSSWGYYCFDPNQMRSSAASPMDRVLQPDGSNLCSVLFTLHTERPREEKRLVEAAKLIEPRLDLISFQTPDPEDVYMFFEDKDGHRFGVQNVSDGTLRFLAISLLTIANRQGNGPREFSPLIMIEEPENGIFVGHLKPLFEKIDPAGIEGQFVFTSHNPYFIDLFDSTLNRVHVVKNLGNYSTISKPDPKRLKELLGKFSLGDMHFQGLLE